jgi:hypothetical protein
MGGIEWGVTCECFGILSCGDVDFMGLSEPITVASRSES